MLISNVLMFFYPSNLSWPILTDPDLPWPTLNHPVPFLTCSDPSWHVLTFLGLFRPVLSWPLLSSLVLTYPILTGMNNLHYFKIKYLGKVSLFWYFWEKFLYFDDWCKTSLRILMRNTNCFVNYQSWLFMTSSKQSWPVQNSSGQSLPVLTSLDQSWPILASPEKSWPLLTIPDHSWLVLTVFDQSWPFLSNSYQFWSFVTSPNPSWPVLIISDQRPLFLTVPNMGERMLCCGGSRRGWQLG